MVYLWLRSSTSLRNSGSFLYLEYAWSSSITAFISVSGTNCPPNSPYMPSLLMSIEDDYRSTVFVINVHRSIIIYIRLSAIPL